MAAEFKRALAGSGKRAAPLLLGAEGRYSIEYVPFDHVNAEAELVIVGITPGPTQRDEAYDEAGRLLRRGAADEDILRAVKKFAAFGGASMRPNLERMIDALGIMTLVGGGRAAELWQGRSHLLHATSVVPHAAFVGGKPFAGSFEEVLRVDLLRRCFEHDFLPTLSLLRRDAYYVGLGPTPAAALSFAADEKLIDRNRILGWLAHPSKQAGSQVSVYLGEKKISELNPKDPVRNRAGALVAAAEELRKDLRARLGGRAAA
ncbi:hypothetical protein IP86_17595 [Rhodopseudomonas sp. AAP120]|nr:hypothetical protein IP86_17595 [Rhodopseudomonas sp. AAP120]